jgi:NTP pyrophosphatase (non-canonical NTP hydrolase)
MNTKQYTVEHQHASMVANLVKPGKDIVAGLDKFKTSSLLEVVKLCIMIAELLDLVKKHVVYGKTFEATVATFDFTLLQELVETFNSYAHVTEKSITPEQAHLLHMAIGIFGEGGEILSAIRSHIDGAPIDVENLTEECGDSEFYLEGLRQAVGLKRETSLVHNYNKLAKRYDGHKYSDAQAIARADKSPPALCVPEAEYPNMPEA